MARTVSALVTCGAEQLGRVGPYAVATPWWSDAGPVVERLGRELGVPVLVLRLLNVEGGEGGRDGHVTYHVEALARPSRPLSPVDDRPADSDLRVPWACVDGLAELLDWARDALADAGRPVTGPVFQHRTWNLAGLFRLPTAAGPVWLKATPRFAADEAPVIAAFARSDPTLVPSVIAAGDRRILLEHLPGEDSMDAAPSVIIDTVTRFVAAQAALAADPPPGLPDRRTPAITAQIRRLLPSLPLTSSERAAALELASRWPDLDDCGLPDTVVHGDFHPMNWRSDGGRAVVIDFADACLGNPVLDIHRLCDFLPPAKRPVAAAVWIEAWRSHAPGADPARALAIGTALGHLLYAVRYQEFLDGIEPDERVYHVDDPVTVIRKALRGG